METNLFDRLPHGVSVIDTGFQRPRFDAAYLVVEEGRAAFVDTGTNHSTPRLLQALADHGLEPADVQWLIVTHVHLDHAGGAGLLMQHLPRAKLVVHPRGARHLVDPSQLMAGMRAVYGEEVARRDYGDLVPISPERVLATEDGMVLHLAQRPLRFLDTPGHARHHHCVWDEASQGCFTGDTLGVSYEAFRPSGVHYALPSTTPIQFDPVALQSSIERLLTLHPSRAYLTHYGAVENVEAQAEMVLRQTDAMVALAHNPEASGAQRLREALSDLYFDHARLQGLSLQRASFNALIDNDVELNAQGLETWRRTTAAAH